MQSDKIGHIVAAMFRAQSEMGTAKKKSDNPFFKSKYADLATVQAVIEKPMADNGLVLIQGGGLGQNGNFVFTTVFHVESGEWLRSEFPLILAKQDAQGIGSCTTYLRRYGICSMFNIEQADDDGNAASKPEYVEKSGIDKLTPTQLDQLRDFKESGYLTATPKEKWHVDAPKWLKSCGKTKLDDLTEAQAHKLIQECEKKVLLKQKGE